MSGRLSSCSVVQEENLVKKMRRTPGTPIKNNYQTTPRKSESKRSLFQTNSPTDSDDLGLMSPLSASSNSSAQSIQSPQFSPNGTFTTPPRTPKGDRLPVRCSPRIASRKIDVKSSLFPDLVLYTPKSRASPRTPKVSSTNSKSTSLDDGVKSLSTPSTVRKSQRRELFRDGVISETDSSPSLSTYSQEKTENSVSSKESNKPTKLGIRPLSCENFYGAPPQIPKARTKLFIDTLESRSGVRELVRSASKESLSSNRSFVSGGSHRRTESNNSQRARRSKSSHSDRRRAPHVGVWHNIKKPKKLKKMAKVEKPLISPKSRLGKMLNSPNGKEIKVKSKPLFQENPRKRVSHTKKRRRSDVDDDIFDSFPDHLIKRKKLPTPQYNVHPAISDKVESPEEVTPDPNKKFLKYGQMRKATFTLSDNVKLQISDGVMKLQTPKKRRKLYSGKKDVIEDFNDFEEGDSGIEQSIQGILNILQSEKDSSQDKEQSGKSTDSQLLGFLESEKENVKSTPMKAIAKAQRSPLKAVSNLSTLILNDFDSDDDENNLNKTTDSAKSGEITLEKTGNMVFNTTSILVNDEVEAETYPSNEELKERETENSPPKDGKYYSLFYKQNWDKSSTVNDSTGSKNQSNKKKILVPDDQYLLDAGQKSIGIVTCKKCGVMYQAGDFADEATHNNFHNHLPELRFMGWTNERIVGRYPDGRVIMILNADPKGWWHKVSKIVDIVDQELGFPEASVHSLFYKTVYLYINEKAKQIAGCLIAEECKVAYRMFPPLEGVDIDSCSKDPTPCKVGISRIWTALSHRRKGVASRMIECLQRTFTFGDIISMDEIAFSVPSPMGKLLAQKNGNKTEGTIVKGYKSKIPRGLN